MPELRQNFFTKESVIIATRWASGPRSWPHIERRPRWRHSWKRAHSVRGTKARRRQRWCDRPANVIEPWAVRVIPTNSLHCQATCSPRATCSLCARRIDGFGFHEVIIDSPDHARCMAPLPDEHVASILRVYRERYNTLSIDRRVNHITIFKNHGAAGASLQHPHLQLTATPVIPSQVRPRFDEALRHDDARECMFCHMVEREVEDQTRVVLKGEHFVAMEVFASPAPFVTTSFLCATGQLRRHHRPRDRRPGVGSADSAGQDLCGAGES